MHRTALEVNWLLVIETNGNSVSLYDYKFNQLMDICNFWEASGAPQVVGTQGSSKVHVSYHFVKKPFLTKT